MSNYGPGLPSNHKYSEPPGIPAVYESCSWSISSGSFLKTTLSGPRMDTHLQLAYVIKRFIYTYMAYPRRLPKLSAEHVSRRVGLATVPPAWWRLALIKTWALVEMVQLRQGDVCTGIACIILGTCYPEYMLP